MKVTTFLIILLIVFLILGFWYYQRNIYSKEILKLEIIGPKEAELAQEVEYIVKYKNNGNIRLEEPKLIFEYPENSVGIEAPDGDLPPEKRELLRQEREIEDIYPGQERTLHFKARLLGKEGTAKVAKASLSYRPKNLKAHYTSDTTLTTLIKSIPITFDFDFPSKTESGKRNLFRLNYFSNIDYPLSNLRIKIEYPAGFEFIESQPKSLGGNEWEIPLLNKAEGGRIEISGILSGQTQESKIFRAQLGIWQEEEFILLKTINYGVTIASPSIFITHQINNSPQYVANPGDYLHYEIFFKNTGEKTLENLFMVVQLEGGVLDFDTLQAEGAQVQKDSGSIIWDHTMVPQLRFLSSMEEGKTEFWVRVREVLSLNPRIVTKITISQAKEEFITKINSKLEIVQKGYFQDEVFGSSGSMPPKVGATTNYTIMWQVKNYYSAVKDVKVKATLPPGIELKKGKIFPEEETLNFAFDSQSREIVWSVRDLEAGRGISTPTQNIFFQIAFTPSLDQKGQTPEIIGQAQITGEDTWTGQILKATSQSINTTLPDDSTITPEMGIVQ